MFGKNGDNASHERDAETIIGPSVKVEGDFTSQGDVVVEGTVIGTMKTEKHLRINDSAVIRADIRANTAFIAGEVHGNVKIAEKLEVTSSAKIFGDVEARALLIAEGGVLQGKCTMVKEEKTKLAHLDANKKALPA